MGVMREKSSGGSLRLKTMLLSGGVLLFLVLAIGLVGTRQWDQTFRTLQVALLDQQVDRFLGQLRNIGNLKILLVREYAEWDESYDFLEGKNENFLSSYYDPGQATNGEDVIVFFDRNRKPVATRWLKEEVVTETPLSAENLRSLTEGEFLAENARTLGCIVENSRVLLVAAGPVLRTNQSGPPAGWLVYGRWIDRKWLNETFDLIGMHVKAITVEDSLSSVHPEPRPRGEALTGLPVWVGEHETGQLRYEAKVVLPVLGSPQVVVISVDIPMGVIEPVVKTRQHLAVLRIIGGICLVLLPLVAMEWVVFRKLTALDREISGLAEGGRGGALVVQGNDEITRLSASINRLMDSERRISEKLKQTEGDTRAIFEAIGDPIFVHGYEDGRPTRFKFVNQSACDFLNRSREELLQLAPGQVDDISPERLQGISRQLAETGHITFETLLIASDGARIPVEIHASHAWLSGEKVCISVARSLVVRKVIDARMREAKEAAESANRAKSEFLATMSHEIRTPLHGVIGFANLLRNSDLPPHLRETVEGISDSADLLLALVTDVLDFSRIEAGQLGLNPQPVHMSDELKRIASTTRLRAEEQGLAFQFSLNENLPEWVLADWVRIEQVLGNLLSNALKFTEKGSISLTVSAQPAGGDRHKITFVVEDTGVGIRPDQRARLFNPFTQADSSLSRRYGGSGLGLVIVKRLCEAMDGSVSLRSEPGRGSAFSASVILQAAVAPPNARPPEPKPPTALSPLRVLVVEDNGLNQKLMRRLVERQGCVAVVARNGREAVEISGSEAFDLIFMDVSMPGMNGLEATRLIRERERERGEPRRFIVALTAGVTENERRACHEAGMDDFLGKPFTDSGLRAVLQKVRQERGGEV
jgi:signal transduction histidine kinase/sensor domain CHASE-containing protein/ActR/RegA family two-component response regulator